MIGLTSGVITRHALRSLDALQLSSAMALRDEIDEEDNVLFIACDNRLLNAAKSEGFAIWNPEISAAPPAPPVN